MIRTLAYSKENGVTYNHPLHELVTNENIDWYWVDFNQPTEEEISHLKDTFNFHHLAIEDCLEFIQRPKIDFYDGYHFLVLSALNQKNFEPHEIDLFVGEKFIVTFHFQELGSVNQLWERVRNEGRMKEGPMSIMYKIIDKLVDEYFPPIYQIEDLLNRLEDHSRGQPVNLLMEQVFDIRGDLSKLRRIIVPTRELLYRILNSQRFVELMMDEKIYFNDIYDHLLKLSEMIETNREISSDIRDSYLSLNSNRMNTIMMTLTVITTIFMPLTFIAGVYGMNFENMPELQWQYGYFFVLGIMFAIAASMTWWFKREGWFNRYKND